mmetsp:Transcript_5315/g.14940  ORF Transcript_5315/g.14940 Transcript_5315/m.14940 type:complete len:210 (+) Transcript_5315:130-759(+)
MEKMWDERYGSTDDFVYGTEPNSFLKEILPSLNLQPGAKCLLLAEGEGRNGVYLAEQGMKVTGVDISQEGLRKAQLLATQRNVKIETVLADLATYDFGNEKWDAIVSISNHLPPPIRERVLHAIGPSLKKGGFFLLEGYTPRQLEFKSGGPPSEALMYSEAILEKAFGGSDAAIPPMSILRNKELVHCVKEGAFHTGDAAVVQFIGRKS